MNLENMFCSNEPKVSPKDRAFEKFAELILKRIEELAKMPKGKKWECPWFKVQGMDAQNMDGRPYNGFNQFVLLVLTSENKWKAPIFATFDKLKSLNYKDGKPLTDKEGNKLPFVTVKKDEKSFPVIMYRPVAIHKETNEKLPMSEYDELTNEEKQEYMLRFNSAVYNVFNLDQTNLSETRPELYKSLISKNEEKMPDGNGFKNAVLDKLISEQLWDCPIILERQNSAFYSPSKDSITLPLYEQFKNGEQFYSTALHEMTHSTGHEDRLNRDLKNRFGSKEYGREELVAEMTSALLCNSLHIQNNVKEEACQYLLGWCKNIKEEPDFIKTVLSDVKKAFDYTSKKLEAVNVSDKKQKKNKRA